MRIFKHLCIFLAVNILIAGLMNFMLTDPSIVRIYLEDIRENEYDTLIIGTSHAETGFDPFMMSEALDAKVFNAARRLMLPMGIVTDERVCGGAEYAQGAHTLLNYLKNPELLELTIEEEAALKKDGGEKNI